MMDNLVRDVQVLWKAESLIGKIWLDVMMRRFALFAFAGLIAVFGLGMANVAGFYGLQESWGPVWAAALVAIADLIIALVIALLGRSVRPSSELDLAFDIRRTAIESIQADAQDLKGSVEALGQQIRQTRETISGFVQHPLNAAAENLLVPAVMSILRGLRARKDEG
jgi:hypothetical protein